MFAKNQLLPSYYYGNNQNTDQTNVQFLPSKTEVNVEKQTILAPNLTKDESRLKWSSNVEDLCLSEPNLIILSPTNSLASNKKLEWDSGADIGYNIQDSLQRKCKSFPILNMDFSISRINNDASKDTDLTICQTNTSSKVKPNTTKIETIRHSTPYDKNRDELRGEVKNKNESIQTSLVQYCSKSIQTDFEKLNKSQQTEKLRTSTEYSSNSASTSKSFEYIAGSKLGSSGSSQTSRKSKLKHSIRSPDVLEIKTPVSTTNSSPILHSNASPTKTNASQLESNVSPSYSNASLLQSNASSKTQLSTEDEVIIFKLDSAKTSNCSKSSKKTSSSSNESNPLGKMISKQQSNNVIDDIDHSLNLLQQFIKSDHYDCETKKYYAKKVVSKLIQFKYSDDSSQSSVTSNRSVSVKSEKIISPTKYKLQAEKLVSPTKFKHKKVQSELNLSNDSNVSKYKKDKYEKEKVLSPTKYKSPCGVHCNCVNDNVSPKYKSEIVSHLQEISNKLKQFKNENSSGGSNSSNCDWRAHKTVSELLRDAKTNSSSRTSSKSSRTDTKIDHSAQTSKDPIKIQTDSALTLRVHKERLRQLSWISKEINYLIRLQGVLENNDLPSENASNQSISDHYDSRRSNLKNCIHHLSSQGLPSNSAKSSDLSTNTQNSSKNASLEKLSKYLTNDQLKFYINNIASNHHESCDCCEIPFVKPDERSHSAREGNENLRRFSYQSHNYNVDKIPLRSCQISAKNSPRDLETQKVDSNKMDAETQYTHRTVVPTGSIKSSTDNSKNTTLIFEQKTTSSSEISNKENCTCSKPERGQRSPYTSCECHPNPYFLTFEETSQINVCECIPKRKPLETVTVKVPKFCKKVLRKTNSCNSFTLEEYLIQNRPDFVAAAEWRRSFVSDRGCQKPKLLFTSREMKKITLNTYKQLPEVQNKIKDFKVLNQRRHNRVMANVFSKKLQKKTLQGQISLATSMSVMATL